VAQNDPMIGNTIDQRFKVLTLVGAGKSGSVYSAQDLTRQYTVALKVLQEKIDDKTKERFRYGVETASVLTHPNIVRIYSFHTTADSRPYFVCDLAPGQNLSDVLAAQGRMTEPQCINMFTQVCDALDYAHAKGVVHRNLKPGNIMLIKAPGDAVMVKIADFGVAKSVGEKETRQSLARKGEMLGNPLYMSPEQCTGQKLDGRSDIYAAGCLMFECLTGQAPFGGNNSFDIMNNHLSAPLPDLESLAPGLKHSSALAAILARATAKKPEERYQDAGDMSRDLNLINEVGPEEWKASAICMKPVELKPQKVAVKPSVPVNPMALLKPILFAGGLLVVLAVVAVATALVDPDVPAIAKYKVAVQELILPPKDPRLLKNLNYMAEYYKARRMYAEAWPYKDKYDKATKPPTPLDETTH
jgi:serine/threonine protein kinase